MGFFDKFANPIWYEVTKLPNQVQTTFIIVTTIYDFIKNHIQMNLVKKFEADFEQGLFNTEHDKSVQLSISSTQSEVLTMETIVGFLRSCNPPKIELSKKLILINPNDLIEILGVFSLSDLNFILKRNHPTVLSGTKYSIRSEEAKIQVLIRWMEILSLKNPEFIRKANLRGFSTIWDEITESMFDGLLTGIERTEKKALMEKGKKVTAVIPNHRRPVVKYFIKKLSELKPNYVGNAEGQPAGKVSKQIDGRFHISLNENADFTSMLTTLFVILADTLSSQQKLIFSKWAGLSTDKWSTAHTEEFALAAAHLIQKAKTNGVRIPDAFAQAAQFISESRLPPLRNKLSPEIIAMINSLAE